ncbi:43222_t:CDS:1, partial [Gigaspora margarita]
FLQLERVQRDKNLGFIAKVNNLNANGIVESSLSICQAVLVYADDTTWIATSKKQIERTIEIAEQFFYINNIEINSSKSKLVVLNSGLLDQDKNISFCKAKL